MTAVQFPDESLERMFLESFAGRTKSAREATVYNFYVMTTDTFTYTTQGGSDTATFELTLAEVVGVANLRALLEIIEVIYHANRTIRCAEHPWVVKVDTDGDELLVELLEIGTPNKLKIKGKLKDLTATVTLLGALLALPVAVGDGWQKFMAGEKDRAESVVIIEKGRSEAIKNRAEAEKAYAEAAEARVKAELARLELVEKAKKLQANGTLSEEQSARITGLSKRIAENAPKAALIVPAQQISVVAE